MQLTAMQNGQKMPLLVAMAGNFIQPDPSRIKAGIKVWNN